MKTLSLLILTGSILAFFWILLWFLCLAILLLFAGPDDCNKSPTEKKRIANRQYGIAAIPATILTITVLWAVS